MMRRWIMLLKRMDWSMLLAAVLLLGIGVAFIYSAGQAQSAAYQRLYLKQMIWAGMGIVCFLGFACLDYHRLYHRAWWLYLLGLALLLLVFAPGVGAKISGARRWIQISGVRLMQPAELAKLALILALARLYGAPGRNTRGRRLAPVGLALALAPFLLIAAQPDLGTALVLLPVLGSVMFAAGAPAGALWKLAAAGALALGAVLVLLLAPPALGWDEARHEALLERFGINAYQKNRVMVFLRRDADPLNAGWNKAQSQIAVGSGRMWGKGFQQGTQNILGFLPRTVAPNDFIFSVIAEEKGFAGALAVLGLMAVLIGGGLRAALAASDRIGRLLCVGVTALLFSHVFVNIAMTIGLLPITGLPLPLLSYGGTFMLVAMSGLGIVQSVYIRGERN